MFSTRDPHPGRCPACGAACTTLHCRHVTCSLERKRSEPASKREQTGQAGQAGGKWSWLNQTTGRGYSIPGLRGTVAMPQMQVECIRLGGGVSCEVSQ